LRTNSLILWFLAKNQQPTTNNQQLITALMRVIAGTYKSRILKSLKGLALRPTSDRLRETLFNVLAPNIAGSRFVDLFAEPAHRYRSPQPWRAEVVFIENHALRSL